MDVTVCCLDEEGALAATARQSGISVEIIKRRPGLDLGLIRRLASFFQREDAYVVHTHGPDPMFYGGWAARLAGIPVRLHTQHDVMLADAAWRDRIKFRLAIPAFHSIVSVSETVRDVITGITRRSRELVTIPNGIDETRFTPNEHPHSDQERTTRDLIIGTVARLSPEKGIDRLVDAFASLARDGARCCLVIVGTGPEERRLVEQVNRLGIAKRVSFYGYCSRVDEVLRGLDVFVLPSLTEGIPLALLEAMAAGLPVVASAVGGVPEVVEDGVSGRLVPADDRDSLRASLDDLLQDSRQRARLGRSARARVRERFSLSSMAASYRELYRRDLATRGWLQPVKRACQLLSPKTAVMWHGPQHRREAALTLDDGPDPVYTPKLLDVLASFGVRSTFFLVGEKAKQHPELVTRIVNEGHELGSHSYSHPDFGQLTMAGALKEIDATREVLSQWSDRPAKRLFRPPYGRVCVASTAAPWLRGETVVLWNVDYKDYLAEEPIDITAKLSRRRPQSGDIVLYHGHNPAALAALPAVLESAYEDGVSFVPVSRMLEAH
jgi:glycosyltransferase involved in cell wall biosynthesis/peptidoglycan/xylan/chitin deacetylase (PgdA/CDA1 family)